MAYHIEKIQLVFRDLPFLEEHSHIFYMESGCDEVMNRCILKNLSRIQDYLSGHFDRVRFIYLPAIYDERMDEVIKYNVPGAGRVSGLANDALLRYLDCPADAGQVGPCIVSYSGKDDEGRAIFRGFSMMIDCAADFPPMVNHLLSVNMEYLESFNVPPAVVFSTNLISDIIRENDLAAERRKHGDDWIEIEQLMEEVRLKVNRLRQYGVKEWALQRLISQEQKLSRLVVTADMCLRLPDYDGLTIRLEPLQMAVYLLFLRHPEGIAFKQLIDYRDELSDLYCIVRVRRGISSKDISFLAIDSLTDPLSNSINEKCSRIRAAFLLHFAESLASEYYITGARGELRRIKLARELVEWEVEIKDII